MVVYCSTGGLVVSGALLSELIQQSGLSRDGAYRIVQRNAASVLDGGGVLWERLAADPDVAIPADRLEEVSDPMRFLAETPVVFDRLRSLTPAPPK